MLPEAGRRFRQIGHAEGADRLHDIRTHGLEQVHGVFKASVVVRLGLVGVNVGVLRHQLGRPPDTRAKGLHPSHAIVQILRLLPRIAGNALIASGERVVQPKHVGRHRCIR